MIVDLHERRDAELLPADVVVVGSGPAGMTLVRELAGSGLRITVLESGRLRPTREGDALRRVQHVRGIAIKDYSRERVLGGASSTWAGLSSPLDEVELHSRPALGLPGWPLSPGELRRYWDLAAQRYRFAPLASYGPSGFGRLKARGDLSLSWQRLEEKVFLAAAEPQHFGKEHKHVFELPGVDLYLGATLLRLESIGAPGHIRRGLVAAPDGRSLPITGEVFVLATGGIENARLLLASTDLCPEGLGNEHDQVGRCLMNHPKNNHGIIRLTRPVRELPYHFGCLYQGYAGYAGLRLTDAEQARAELLNAYVRFEPLFPWSDNRGVESLVLLVKRSKLLFQFWKRRHRDEVVTLRDYSETGDDSELQNERKSALGWLGLTAGILLHLPSVARYVVARLSGRAPLVQRVRLRNFMEMEPHPENRVTLSHERDAHGERLARVAHDTTERDRRSLKALHAALAEELQRNGFGALESDLGRADPWPIDLDASHHLGTTRMGHDRRESVTNADGRLHGVDNVYLAGGSLFPTSGCANPTFTIVALAIRLAEHLATTVFAGRVRQRQPDPGRPSATDGGGAGGRRRVLVLGAGERVVEDVLPALFALSDRYQVVDVFARSRRPLEVAGRVLETRDVRTLGEGDLAAADLVYVAVSKDSVPRVLRRFAEWDKSRVELLLDTPVLLFKHLGALRLLQGWRAVSVAEDCTRLPWLDTVRLAQRAWLGELTRVELHHAAWRYHAFALLKTLFDGAPVRSARQRRQGDGSRVDLRFAGGRSASLLEPRDYARGHWRLHGRGGVLTDATSERVATARLLPLVEGGLVTGFAIGEQQTVLSRRESQLLGAAATDATVTQLTAGCKRVGLMRMLAGLDAGQGGWPLAEGLDDMALDYLLERAGRYLATPVSSLRSPLGRALIGGALRLAVRT